MAQYTFSQPIRYYKANDPYYYEVDNLSQETVFIETVPAEK